MDAELRTEIDIDAPPSKVWGTLVTFAAYASWNPFITSAEGAAEVGERLVLRMEPPGGRAMTFRPTVTAAEPEHALEWLGHLVVPGIFDGRHRFELRASGAGTRLVQREHFGGLLTRLPLRRLQEKTLAGFEAMNVALRDRCQLP